MDKYQCMAQGLGTSGLERVQKALCKMIDLKDKGVNLEKEKGILRKRDSPKNRNNLTCLGK